MAHVDAIAAFYDECARHDWYYQESDDGRKYIDGLKSHNALRAQANADADLAVMYISFQDYHTSGPVFGTPRAPMPERPCGQLTLC